MGPWHLDQSLRAVEHTQPNRPGAPTISLLRQGLLRASSPGRAPGAAVPALRKLLQLTSRTVLHVNIWPSRLVLGWRLLGASALWWICRPWLLRPKLESRPGNPQAGRHLDCRRLSKD